GAGEIERRRRVELERVDARRDARTPLGAGRAEPGLGGRDAGCRGSERQVPVERDAPGVLERLALRGGGQREDRDQREPPESRAPPRPPAVPFRASRREHFSNAVLAKCTHLYAFFAHETFCRGAPQGHERYWYR